MNAVFKHVFPTVLATLVNGFLLAQELPIKPARTVSFTTTEGSYMDVDVSPDGKTLVFDLLGDLYTLPAKGGIAKQLTRGLALHTRPVWSPDGKKIAYVSDETGLPHMQVMDVTHGYKTVLGDMDGALTLNNYGDNIGAAPIYFYDAVWSLNSYSVTYGGKTYRLDGKEIPSPTTIPKPLRFSTDGKTAWGIDSGKIFRYDLQRGICQPISQRLDKYLSGVISPDGRWWCYIADIGISTVYNPSRCLKLIAIDLQNGSHRILVDSLGGGGANRLSVPPPHFSLSPDSRNIYIGYRGKIHRIDIETSKNRTMGFKANVKVDLGAYNYHTQHVDFRDFNVKYCRSASESPDGKHVVFQALSKIYMMDLPNGKPHILCLQPFGQFQPAWSPDSKWITYTSWCDTVGGFLWKVPAAGGKPEQWTKVPGQYNSPTWAPDGLSVAVLYDSDSRNNVNKHADEKGKIEIISANSGSIEIVDTAVSLYNTFLSFSKDGRKLFYTPLFKNAWHKNINELVSKDLKTGEKQLVAKGDAITFSSQQSLSPDGRYIVYSANEDLYLLPLTHFGDPAVLSGQPGNRLYGIRFAPGVDPHWENGGEVLAWTYGNKFFRINPDRVIANAEIPTTGREHRDTILNAPTTIKIVPDQMIQLNVKVPASYGKGLIALKNATILTMHGSRFFKHGTILVENGRIIAIGSTTNVHIPPQSKILDLTGKTIIPGFVDVHLHGLVIGSSQIFRQQTWPLLTSLAYGVTTARNPSGSFHEFGYSELLRSGQMIGPRFYTVGVAIDPSHGVLHLDNQLDENAEVHKRLAFGASEIKNYAQPTRIQREWLLKACEKYKVNMTNEGMLNPVIRLGQIKDGSTGIEHNAVWDDIHGDMIFLMAKAHTYLTPTLVAGAYPEKAQDFLNYRYWRYPDAKWRHFIYDSDPLSSRAKLVDGRLILSKLPGDSVKAGFLHDARVDARLLKAGVNVVMGSHGNDKGIGPHDELWALQAGGLSNLQALQAATINGAKALGIQKDIGSLEVGKIADLLILDKNPLDDIHNSRDIRYVMQGGILYDANTLDEQWPIKKKCPDWQLKTPSAGKGQ